MTESEATQRDWGWVFHVLTKGPSSNRCKVPNAREDTVVHATNRSLAEHAALLRSHERGSMALTHLLSWQLPIPDTILFKDSEPCRCVPLCCAAEPGRWTTVC